MSNFEVISGDKAADLINMLQRGNVLVKVSVPRSDYSQLTVITDIQKQIGNHYFRIDPPQGLHAALDQKSDKKLLFEFSSDDKLPHRFESLIKTLDKEMWLHFPEQIQRFQLRDNFRLKAPGDAYVTGTVNETPVKMIVDNLSLGGLFCHCPNAAKPHIEVGLKLKNLTLEIFFAGQGHAVTVGRAVVRRLEGRTQPKHFGVAFQFLSITNEDKKRLTQIVYDLQRDYLRNRVRDD